MGFDFFHPYIGKTEPHLEAETPETPTQYPGQGMIRGQYYHPKAQIKIENS